MAKKPVTDRVDDALPDMKAELVARLKAVMPEAFSDGQLDLERLAELAGDTVATGAERYGLTWPGKRDSIAMLQTPTAKPLPPTAPPASTLTKRAMCSSKAKISKS